MKKQSNKLALRMDKIVNLTSDQIKKVNGGVAISGNTNLGASCPCRTEYCATVANCG